MKSHEPHQPVTGPIGSLEPLDLLKLLFPPCNSISENVKISRSSNYQILGTTGKKALMMPTQIEGANFCSLKSEPKVWSSDCTGLGLSMLPVNKKAMAFTKEHFPQDTSSFNSSCWSTHVMTQGPFHYHAQPLSETEHFPPMVLLLPSEGPEYKVPLSPSSPHPMCLCPSGMVTIHRWFHRMANIRGLSGPLRIQLNLAAVYGSICQAQFSEMVFGFLFVGPNISLFILIVNWTWQHGWIVSTWKR